MNRLPPGPAAAIVSAVPSPFTSPTATRDPPANPGNGSNRETSVPVGPSYTTTVDTPPPAPAANRVGGRTAVGVTVAVLSAGSVSTRPAIGVIVAVAGRGPANPTGTIPVMVYTTDPPMGRLTAWFTSPVPDAVPAAPPLNTAVQVTPVRESGTSTATTDPRPGVIPVFVNVAVYVSVCPVVTGSGSAVIAAPKLILAGTTVGVTVAVSFAGFPSSGLVIVAVAGNGPVVVIGTPPVMVYTTDPPMGRLTISFTSPMPDAVPVAPPANTAVQITPVRESGTSTATVELGAAAAPSLVNVAVYVSVCPAVTGSGLAVIAAVRSGAGVAGDTVAVLFDGSTSPNPAPAAAVAVAGRLPMKLAGTTPVIVYTTDPPVGRSTVSLMSPDPAAVPVAPPEKTAVQVTPVRAAGTSTVTVEPVAASVPALVNVAV